MNRLTRKFLLRSVLLTSACSALFATYTYYFTDALTTINTTNWTQNGTLTAGSGGLTSSAANGGSLISKVAVPDGSSNYEVKTTLTLTQSGGTYVTYLRASSNALSGPGVAGTAYAFEVQNPTFSGSACSAILAGYKIVSGSVTALASEGIPCHNGMTLRVIYAATNHTIYIYIDNVGYYGVQDTSIASGQPGIGVRGAPAGNSIAQVQLGGIFVGTPVLPTSEIGVSAFSNKVEIQWPAATEAPSGPGIAFYELYRNGVYVDNPTDDMFIDLNVSPSTNYTYWILAFDFDFNAVEDIISVTTPPAGTIDAQETGVRPTGSYWGGGGEQIDMRSGNLNYTMPILKAMGRGGWSVGFNLTYNSQNWRQDSGGTWQSGVDVGYGYGWKLLAGSLLPFNTAGGVGAYIFTDSTGAQYHLTVNSGGLWTSTESTYVTYDANAGKLHFNDGSFWVLGCTSSASEWDAGTMYPTMMEDSNGNQVMITYNDGLGVTWPNSSSRINTIEDVRGNGAHDYTFSYNTDAIQHLTGIANTIGTAENYSFAYTENYSLNSPFNGNPNFGTVALLKSSTVSGIPLTTYFTYDNFNPTVSCSSPGTGTTGPGQLTQVTTPYCGHLRWTYAPNTLSGSRTYSEVQNRYLSMSVGATETAITLVRANDTAYSVHSSATLDDTPANSEKFWSFQTDTTQFNGGLQLSYEERTLSTHTPLSHLDFTWAQTPTSLNPYIGTTVTKLDPGQTYEADKKTVQTLDQYGNLLTILAYNFGTGAVGSLARTYTNTYLTDPNYTSRYILNRLQTSTVTDGTNTATLVQNYYETQYNGALCGPFLLTNITGQYEHDDANYGTSFVYRGIAYISVTPTTTTCLSLDIDGNAVRTIVNGVTSTVTSANNYAAPGSITTNSLTSTMSWNNFLGLSSASGPNGDTGSIQYDGNARPASTTSPYGATTSYTYADTSSPPYKLATTNGHWVQTVMDGFGRTIISLAAYGSTVVSRVDTQYAPCGCSPLGKLSQQSEPYGPTGGDQWTVYHYDASGRTTSVVLPDGSTTNYVYKGNAVTVSDPASKWKVFYMDAFGNLVGVLEPDPTLQTNVSTGYGYDILNHLTNVYMPRGSNYQGRSFNYNSGTTLTGLLQSATNPENGTVSYTYNSPSNNLASKSDAKGQQLTYQYDNYNRLTSVTWANATGGPQVLRTYYYDTNPLDTTGTFSQNSAGRLTAVQYPAQRYEDPTLAWHTGPQLSEWYSYTVPGLPAKKRVQVNQPEMFVNYYGQHVTQTATANLDTSFSYNNEGKITFIAYPSTVTANSPGGTVSTPGPSYNYSYDGMYRISGMTDANNNTLVSGVTYNAANQMLTMGLNAGTETRGYNSLNQLISLSMSGYQGVNLTYTYPAGANNGKISSMYNAISGETITYTYDSLNRLLTANGSGWGEQYGYDPFGNLLTKNVTAGAGPSMSLTVSETTNQVSIYRGYDANGNPLSYSNGNQLYNLGYDAENRLAGATWTSNGDVFMDYAYDAQNRRIWNWEGTANFSNEDSNYNMINYAVSVYTPGGQKIATYTLSPSLWYNGQATNPYIQVSLASADTYFGARRLAAIDQLGSVGTYFPWGEPKGGNNPQDTWSYATYWTDSFTSLNYANNRYYSNAYGRFMTPDPYRGNSGGPGDAKDPQSWNRYAYTRGDPVNRADPAGTCDLQISFWGDDTFYTNCDPSLGSDFNPSAYAQCMATPGCMQGGQGAAEAGAVYAQGGSIPTSVTNVQHLNTPMFGNLASALANTDCGKWFQAGLATSGVGGPGESLTSFLTNTLPTVTGSGNFVGGNANGIESAGYLAPGYSILFNNAGAFFSPLNAGQSIAFSTQYVSQYASMNGGSSQAQAFLLLHELAHALGMFLPDANSTANQGINNDDLWRNCGSVIQSFSNKGPSQ